MRYTFKKVRASGRRTSWAKVVHGVASGRGAKGFVGSYLRDGDQVDLDDGALILHVVPDGSVKNGWEQAILKRVENGALVTLGDWNWRSEYLDLQDAVREELDRAPRDRERAEQSEAPAPMSFDVMMHYIAQGVLNIREGETTIEADSPIYRAMAQLCELVTDGYVTHHGLEYNDTCGCAKCEGLCDAIEKGVA